MVNTTEVISTGGENSSEEQIKAFIANLVAVTDKKEPFEMDRYAFGAWSHSKLKVLEKCPFQFYLKYILKIKAPQCVLELNDTTAADVGSAAHLVLEHVVMGKSMEESYALSKAKYCPEKLSPEIWAERLETTEFNIGKFRDKIEAFKRIHKVKKIFTEIRVGVTRDWKPTTFFANDVYFRGVLDLAILLENHDLIIIDHKYGPPASMGIRNFKQQLDTYKPLLHFGFAKLSGATAGVHFIRDGELMLGDFSTKDEIESKLKNTLEWNVGCAVDSVKEKGFFKHIRGPHCKYCEYDSMCKPGDLKAVELSTKKFFTITPV